MMMSEPLMQELSGYFILLIVPTPSYHKQKYRIRSENLMALLIKDHILERVSQ